LPHAREPMAAVSRAPEATRLDLGLFAPLVGGTARHKIIANHSRFPELSLADQR
jgi:hypothetical protein